MQVVEDGTAKLYLGTELVEHAVGVDSASVMRVLVDYAATIDDVVRVTTQMPDGTWTRHRLGPDGSLTPLPRRLTAAPAAATPDANAEEHRAVSSLIGKKLASRGWLLAILVLLVAALLAVLAT